VFTRIVFGNGRFVLLGHNGNYVSTDGVNWTPVPNHFPYELSHLIYSNGVFADFYGSQFAASQDGVAWQTQDVDLLDFGNTGASLPENYVTGLVYGNGMYVAAGEYPENYPFVITSRDAVKWTMTRFDESRHIVRIAFNNGLFVAAGADGGILTSTDGVTWTNRETGAKASYDMVSFCNNKFVALGDGGTISTSPDGVNWTNSRSSYQAVFTVGQANYILNGQTYPTDAAPFIEDGRVLVPVRYLGDALDADVGWIPTHSQIIYLTKTMMPPIIFGVTLLIGSKTIICQRSSMLMGASITKTMDVATMIRNGRTYIPARFVAEAFGRTVTWDQVDRTVTIE
jgi:hypothetical protein